MNDFEYGFNLKTLQKFRSYWANKYDWRKWERVLNKLPQFTTEIEGLKVSIAYCTGLTKNVRTLLDPFCPR